MKCTTFKEVLRNHLPMMFDCREQDGRLVIETPIEYPDGDHVELYVVEESGGLVLTDLAETVRVLGNYNFDLKRSPKRFRLFEDILRAHDVHYFQGCLRIPIRSPENLPQALMRMVQAVLGVSDLLFTMRFGAGTAFKEEVEEFLIEHEIPYELDYKVVGRSAHAYTVDFYIERVKPHLVETLSSAAAGPAEILVNSTVRMWFDLKRINGRFGYISLLDDSADVWKASHLDILSDLSEVIVWSERKRLLEALSV